MLTNDVVNPAILLRKGNAEIAPQHITDKNDVLFPKGLVETVAGFQVPPDLVGYRLIVH